MTADRTILVVDDEPSCIELLTSVLGGIYEVCVATGGQAALEMMKKKKPDLILLDILMPEMDGYAVLEQIQRDPRTRGIPVIFLTGLTNANHEVKGLELGAVDYIAKPFSPAIVRVRIRNQLALLDARRALEKQNAVLSENIALKEEIDRMTRHDIKSPLSCIINIPLLMLQEGRFTPEQQRDLKTINELGYRILDMINNSMELYRMETGRYHLKPEPVDMIEVVSRIRQEMRIQYADKAIEIRMRLEGSVPGPEDRFMVMGEALLCYTMMTNVIKNAVEACNKNEAVTIELKGREDREICIHNPGCVPLKIRERFFDKYITHGKPGGTGLGTYSARLMALAQHGDILLETDDIHGTWVIVRLPGITGDRA